MDKTKESSAIANKTKIDNAKGDEKKMIKKKFQRDTKLDKTYSDPTIKSLFKKRKTLRFDLAIQRGEVWTLEQKSMLIHSILYGFPIPPVLVQETDDEYVWFLDGKQRLTSILGYMNGDYALSKNTPDVFGHKIAGFKYEDLSDELQDAIADEQIRLIRMKQMTDEERDALFVRWNSGTTLSKIELTRAMHSDLIEQINHIADLEFFADDVALTGKARNRFVDQEIILQIAMLLDEGKDNIKGFGSAQVKDYVLRLKNVNKLLSDDLIKQFELVSKYLNMSVSNFDLTERKKALKKIHIPIVFYTAIRAMDEKVKPSVFGDFVRDFLITNYSIESDYGVSCQAGSSKKESVQIRIHEMNVGLTEFLKKISSPETKEKIDVKSDEKSKLETVERTSSTRTGVVTKPTSVKTVTPTVKAETIEVKDISDIQYTTSVSDVKVAGTVKLETPEERISKQLQSLSGKITVEKTTNVNEAPIVAFKGTESKNTAKDSKTTDAKKEDSKTTDAKKAVEPKKTTEAKTKDVKDKEVKPKEDSKASGVKGKENPKQTVSTK